MKKSNMLLASLLALTLSAPAFATEKETYETKTKISKDTDGNYKEKSHTEKTDVNGTSTSVDEKVKVDVDSNGSVEKEVDTTKVTDPKGMLNKETTKTKDSAKMKKDGSVETKHKVVVNGKTVENTTDTTK